MYVITFAVILLDYTSQAAINPCESLMADVLRSASQSDTGFMIYSAMLSMGSCIGYLLSAVDWQAVSQTTLWSSEQTAIIIVLILFNITLFVTLCSANERPLRSTTLLHNGGPVPHVNGDAKIPLDEVVADETSLFIPKEKIKRVVANTFQLTFIMACVIKV